MEAEFKEKVDQAQNEAKEAKDKLMQCKKDAEKVKEDGGQEKEITRCKIGEAKEELMQYKIEKVKEELMQCKIDMAKVETEWYKKAAEECKNEKRIGTDKPSIRGEDENDRGKHITNEDDRIDKDKPSKGDGNDRGKHITNEGGNENGEITSREITPDHSLKENCGERSKKCVKPKKK